MTFWFLLLLILSGNGVCEYAASNSSGKLNISASLIIITDRTAVFVVTLGPILRTFAPFPWSERSRSSYVAEIGLN